MFDGSTISNETIQEIVDKITNTKSCVKCDFRNDPKLIKAWNSMDKNLDKYNFKESTFPEKIHDVNFISCNLQKSSFDTCQDLQDCKFTNCNLDDSNWENSMLDRGLITDSSCQNMNLKNGSFHNLIINNSNFTNSDFYNRLLVNTSFTDCKFNNNNFHQMFFTNLSFTNCELLNSYFKYSRGTGLTIFNTDIMYNNFDCMTVTNLNTNLWNKLWFIWKGGNLTHYYLPKDIWRRRLHNFKYMCRSVYSKNN